MKTTHAIECLEARIAPAAVLTFTDIDGDSILVKTSKGTSDDLKPLITTEAMGMGVAIREIDLSKAWTIFDGTTLSVLVTKKGASGDGLVNVRYIDAAAYNDGGDMNLGSVVVQGDLGKIDAGRNDGRAVASLTLKSYGVADAGMYGFNTNPSFLKGGVGAVSIAGGMQSVSLNFADAGTISVGSMQIASFFGNDDVMSVRIGSMQTAALKAGTFGQVTVASMTSANNISATGSIGGISVNGPVNGFTSMGAASVGKFLVKGSFDGLLQPGILSRATVLGDFSGTILAAGIGSLNITGKVTGDAEETGYVSVSGNVGSIRVTGDVLGGFGKEIGFFEIGGNAGSIRIGGSLKAFGALSAGLPMVEIDDNGAIRVGGNLGKLQIGGDLVGTSILATGYSSDTTGAVIVQGNLGSAVIGGDIRSGQEAQPGLQSSGTIQVGKNLGSLLVKGDVLGGVNNQAIISVLGADGPSATLAIGKITILGDVKDTTIRSGDSAAEIVNKNNSRDESIGTLKVGGDFVRSSVLAGETGVINNMAVSSKIARIIIGGTAAGGNMNTSYGFLAEEIGAFRVAGKNFTLKAGALNDPEFDLDPAGNTVLHEVTL